MSESRLTVLNSKVDNFNRRLSQLLSILSIENRGNDKVRLQREKEREGRGGVDGGNEENKIV